MKPDPVVSAVRHVVAPVTRTRLFRWLAPRLLPIFEDLTRGLSSGHVQVSGLLVHSLQLHSFGAKTGTERITSLMYTPDGNGCAIVAGTSFGRQQHPSWTYNLLENPDAYIDVRGRLLEVRAELIGDDERDEAWELIQAQWPGYRAYERESGRVVRLFRLRPLRELRSA